MLALLSVSLALAAAAAAAAPSEDLHQLAAAVADFHPRPLQPCKGRGIVVSAGGPVLLSNTLSLLGALRQELGSQLPLEIFHAGAGELDARDAHFLEASFPNVTVVDAQELPYPEGFPEAFSQSTGASRGYQTKVLAALQSSFCEVLMLDADNTPMRDPAVLFEEPLYRQHGNLFWPDYNCTAAWVSPALTEALGLPAPSLAETSTESGAFLLDKSHHQDALDYAWLLNAHHDVIYGKYAHGDKDLYRLGFQLAGKGAAFAQVQRRPAAVYTRGAGAKKPFAHFAMVQHSPGSGEMVLLHRTTLQSKLLSQAPHMASDLVVTEPLSLAYVFGQLRFEQPSDFAQAAEAVRGASRAPIVLRTVHGLLRRETELVQPAIEAGSFLSSLAHGLGNDTSVAHMAETFYSHSQVDSGHYRNYFVRRLTNETNSTESNTTTNETTTETTTAAATSTTTSVATSTTAASTTTATTSATAASTTTAVTTSIATVAVATDAVVTGQLSINFQGDAAAFVADPLVKASMKTAIATRAGVPAAYVTDVVLAIGRRLQEKALRRLEQHIVLVDYVIRIPATAPADIRDGSSAQASIATSSPTEFTETLAQLLSAEELDTVYTGVIVSAVAPPALTQEAAGASTTTEATTAVATTDAATTMVASTAAPPSSTVPFQGIIDSSCREQAALTSAHALVVAVLLARHLN